MDSSHQAKRGRGNVTNKRFALNTVSSMCSLVAKSHQLSIVKTDWTATVFLMGSTTDDRARGSILTGWRGLTSRVRGDTVSGSSSHLHDAIHNWAKLDHV